MFPLLAAILTIATLIPAVVIERLQKAKKTAGGIRRD
jgi:hypothetical protein